MGCPSGQDTGLDLARQSSGASRSINYIDFVQTRADGTHSLNLMVSGVHCAGCVAKIERNISALDGVQFARMNLSTLRLTIHWTGAKNKADQIANLLSSLGYGTQPFDIELQPLGTKKQLSKLLKAMAVAGFASANIMLLSVGVWASSGEMTDSQQTLMHWISALIAIPVVAYSGRVFFASAWQALKNRTTNMDVPISLALILACALSLYETINKNPDTYFDAAVMLCFLLLIGRYLDMRLRLRTGESAQRLAAMQAHSANLILPDGSIKSVRTSQVKPGDLLLIAAGENVPVDGQIKQGISEVDASIATGEALPQHAKPGDKVYSGMINIGAPLQIEALAVSEDSFLSEISKMVEAGEQKKSRYVKIADKAAKAYVPIVHSLALLTFLGWLMVGGEIRTAMINAIAVLIITCPCALGLAVPAVQIVAAGRLFKKGVLIRSGDALERLAKIDNIIFDKTGTLTLGRLALANGKDISKDQLESAAKLARASTHPKARAVARAAGKGPLAKDIKEIPGKGLQAIIDGKSVKFVSGSWCGVKRENDMRNMAWLKIGTRKPVMFEFKDRIRGDSLHVIEQLKDRGYELELLSGDTVEMARTVAQDLGIQKWAGEVSPKDKLARLGQLQEQGLFPMMVGDGINDAPALAAATASASPATAAMVTRASSDIILLGDDLEGLPVVLEVAQKAQQRVKENLGLAVVYNILAVPLAVFGFVNPLIAAIAMSLSSLLVTLNALRMRVTKPERRPTT
ncbi:MAG: cadmium-translocating P-type ATPase [Acidimicrobiales bacterium]|nr:MAG: cadmium-translocating P-type ATPase [Acidimicrobiales bacterium]